ncbi:MAG: AAA family ATPase [Nitrososphaeraceae archaeon]
MSKCIAFHSYKGGTGKTTLACNSAILLAKRGYSVCLLDLDIYAPSFHLYFSKEPRKWINDFLTSSADIRDVMIDVTDSLNNQRRQSDTIESIKRDDGNEVEVTGKLWVGFSNPQKKEIFKLEIADAETKRQAIRRFVQFREILTSELGADYIIVDTSPGIRFWSINSLAIADILLLTLKMSDLDIDGTRIVAEEIYRFFIELGSKAFLVYNMVQGYCVPREAVSVKEGLSNISTYAIAQPLLRDVTSVTQLPQRLNEIEDPGSISTNLGVEIISFIPCYCDIQFLKKEFLTVIKYRHHPFTSQIEKLIDTLS